MVRVLDEVFTADELARAAGVSSGAVRALLEAGEAPFIPGTRFLRGADAVRLGRRLRPAPAHAGLSPDASLDTAWQADNSDTPNPVEPAELFATVADHHAPRQTRVHVGASTLVHVLVVAAVLWMAARPAVTAPVEAPPRDRVRMVFLATPGPGGGGGGGGTKSPLPPRRVERQSPRRAAVQVPAATPERVIAARRVEQPPPRPTPVPPPQPAPVERAPEPLPARVLVAPVVASASSDRDEEGVIDGGGTETASQGAGTGGGAGTGAGVGNGEGQGSGIGEGSGGGTGGGPFRPGSGIEPPRLLREVKAEYTDQARRRGLTGDVLLEIVVRRDGSVGQVTLLQGLGAGLDERAVAAVRQWRFSPARRRGEPVDVLVEVAVEFTLR